MTHDRPTTDLQAADRQFANSGPVPPRCILFFPGTRPELYAKAMASGADQVCMDLEDAVAPDSKEEARDAALSVLRRADFDPARFVLRINQPGTPDGARDLEALSDSEPGRATPWTLMVPKVHASEELEDLRSRLHEGGLSPSLLPVIETAEGLARVEAVAAVDSICGLLFGGLDLSVDLGAALDWDALLYARSRVVLAARLGGVSAIDMPFLRISDPEGLRDEAERVHRLGFKGKAAIHPGHVDALQTVFSPSEQEVERARRITDAARENAGVFLLDGVMVDRPGIIAARRILARADAHLTDPYGD